MVDRSRDVVSVSPTADEERDRSCRDIARGHRRELALDLELTHGLGKVDEAIEPCGMRHVGEQRVD